MKFIFSDAKIPYDDIRYEQAEWPAVKPSKIFSIFLSAGIWRHTVICFWMSYSYDDGLSSDPFFSIYRNANGSDARLGMERPNAAAGNCVRKKSIKLLARVFNIL